MEPRKWYQDTDKMVNWTIVVAISIAGVVTTSFTIYGIYLALK